MYGNALSVIVFNFSPVGRIRKACKVVSALLRMYAKGLGIPSNAKESQRWAKLAENQNLRASKVCVAPKMVKEIDQLMTEQRQDPAIHTLQVAALT
jgi:TPR repeat protein